MLVVGLWQGLLRWDVRVLTQFQGRQGPVDLGHVTRTSRDLHGDEVCMLLEVVDLRRLPLRAFSWRQISIRIRFQKRGGRGSLEDVFKASSGDDT